MKAKRKVRKGQWLCLENHGYGEVSKTWTMKCGDIKQRMVRIAMDNGFDIVLPENHLTDKNHFVA